ncbi:MAG: helix-turn-helix domain-containing protein [Ruminiclostridium sp.]
MITYERFWTTLYCKDLSTYVLINKHHISSSTINRLRHNLPISTETIDKLCKAPDCDVDDIIKYIDNEQEA